MDTMLLFITRIITILENDTLIGCCVIIDTMPGNWSLNVLSVYSCRAWSLRVLIRICVEAIQNTARLIKLLTVDLPYKLLRHNHGTVARYRIHAYEVNCKMNDSITNILYFCYYHYITSCLLLI